MSHPLQNYFPAIKKTSIVINHLLRNVAKWPQSYKLFKKFLKTIALAYIYQLAKFGYIKEIYIQKCTLSHDVMGWLKKEKLEYLVNTTYPFWEQ